MRHAFALFLTAAVAMPATASEPQEVPAPLEFEESETASLPAISPRWVLSEYHWAGGATRIFDGDTGNMLGQISISQLANLTPDPNGRYFYVAETIWTKGTRGTRQDLLTIRDARTLNVVREVALPGRLLVGNRRFTLGVSGDGAYAFAYNMDPASSIAVVDLARQRLLTTVEVPGCSLSAGFGPSASISLCSDGTATLVSVGAGKKPAVTPSAVFFAADTDPVFDNFAVNSVAGEAVFLTYSGKVVSATREDGIKLGEPWSVQEAAGYAAGTTEPLVVNWYPGGRQPLAYSKAADRIYVLMHKGEFWSQKQPGEELWVFQASTRKLLKRALVPSEIISVEVSQDAEPLLYVASEASNNVWDALTHEKKREIEDANVVMLSVPAMAR